MTGSVPGPTIKELENHLNSDGSAVAITTDGRVVPAGQPSMIERMAKDMQANQIRIWIDDLVRVTELRSSIDPLWTKVARYLVEARTLARVLK